MKRILYVDFENVSSAGLNGMSDLTTDDEVKIFLGPKCSKMSLIEADNIFHGDATVELIKNDQIAKNALDFIIMVHLGYDVAKKAGDLFFIISNDKGYDPAIREMQVMTGETIARYQDIAQVIKRNDVKPGLLARLFGRKPAAEGGEETAVATEHEVIKKGHSNRGGSNNRGDNRGNGNRNGNSNRNGNNHGNGSGSRNNSNGNNGGNRNNGRNNAGSNRPAEKNNRPANAQNEQKNNRPGNAQAEQKNVVRVSVNKEEPKKPVSSASENAKQQAPKKPAEVIRRSTETEKPVNKPVISPEDDYLDGMSIAELRAQLTGNKKNNNSTAVDGKNSAAAPAKEAASAKSNSRGSHNTHGRVKTVLTDSEAELVNRAIAETDNLGDFHNYILKELHDNDRATEIYKSEKYRVKIVKPEKPEPAKEEKPVTETAASEEA